jgi:hypothetical protein
MVGRAWERRAGDHDGEVWQWREQENVDGFQDYEEGSLGST